MLVAFLTSDQANVCTLTADAMDEEDEEDDLIQRAEAALALPDEHFLEAAAKHAPTKDAVNAAASLE